MKKFNLIIIFKILFIINIFSGCDNQEYNTYDVIGSSDQPLYVLSTNVWQNKNIPVCWETAGFATDKNWVKDTIENTWEYFLDIDFQGWGNCTASATGIRIQIEDVAKGPHTSGLGTGLDGLNNGMALNFTFNNWVNDDGTLAASNCRFNPRRESCIRAIAAHEFGHALSLSHEQIRTDTPAWCTKPDGGSPGDTPYGDWDRDSIMNYCNPKWNNGGKLSTGDIEGAWQVYGTNPNYIAAIMSVI